MASFVQHKHKNMEVMASFPMLTACAVYDHNIRIENKPKMFQIWTKKNKSIKTNDLKYVLI